MSGETSDVLNPRPGGPGFTAWLADDGSLIFESPAGAA